MLITSVSQLRGPSTISTTISLNSRSPRQGERVGMQIVIFTSFFRLAHNGAKITPFSVSMDGAISLSSESCGCFICMCIPVIASRGRGLVVVVKRSSDCPSSRRSTSRSCSSRCPCCFQRHQTHQRQVRHCWAESPEVANGNNIELHVVKSARLRPGVAIVRIRPSSPRVTSSSRSARNRLIGPVTTTTHHRRSTFWGTDIGSQLPVYSLVQHCCVTFGVNGPLRSAPFRAQPCCVHRGQRADCAGVQVDGVIKDSHSVVSFALRSRAHRQRGGLSWRSKPFTLV